MQLVRYRLETKSCIDPGLPGVLTVIAAVVASYYQMLKLKFQPPEWSTWWIRAILLISLTQILHGYNLNYVQAH